MMGQPPAPYPARKAEAIALAMKNFDRLQESRQGIGEEARLSSVTGPRGLIGGLKMLIANNTRAVLAATTALAAVALIAVVPVLTRGPGALEDALNGGLSEQAAKPEVVVAPNMATPEIVVEEAEAPMAADAPAPAPRGVFTRAMPAPKMRAGDAARARELGAIAPTAQRNEEFRPEPLPVPEADTEAFPEAEDNPVKVTAESPVSTFSIDVDTASWSILRNSLTAGTLPPKDAVRIEEMVNYFSYDYPAPEGGMPFATQVGVSDSPWRAGTQLVQIGLQGAMPAERPAMNLVFLVDTSGSMQDANKLPLLKQSFRLMLGQLGAEDRVSIVTYAGSAGRVLEPTPASERQTILAALDRLEAGGSTAGQAGLQQAYATAAEMKRDGAVARVILATDGDFNVGISEPGKLKDYIAAQRDSGTYLSVLGFGRGNLDDATMQALAQNGNGMAAYIDTLAEAQKVLVDQLTGALVPIADDVKIQVEWNPALVAEYRLIGYETRALRREDFNNDKVDAGEIGAGHQVTALYEITPVGSDARMTDPLRYAAEVSPSAEAAAVESDELGFLRLRYKAPGEAESQLIEAPILADAGPLAQADWAVAIAGFGQLLKGSTLIGDWSMGDAIALAQASKGADPYGYRSEAITLMRLAESLMQ
ncbi:vWA domain-containing protein [Sagittula sp. S175]|uniref:vWA domain-containing protein n=1 Tax=Sagittula sp. S175 TaxID=3415129 RepID=UPI003C7DD5B3